MTTKLIQLLIIPALIGMLVDQVYACTGLRLFADDGGVVVGRTMEFGFDVQSDAVVVPSGTKLTSSLDNRSEGMHYISKYGMVGANVLGMNVIVDGINEKGLYVGGFYFPGYASYPDPAPETASKSLAPEDYGAWLLANFASVEEVKANFDKVILVPHPLEEIGGESFPAHYLVHDSSGASVVIEPINKTLKIYDNPIGVLTNSPNFEWHTTNLRNYINLSATNVPPIEIAGTKFSQLGQGSGMLGIPGDVTPPSRFVRAVVFSQSAKKSATTGDSVLQTFHIMNTFDIPVGAARDVHGNQVSYDYTLWTSASDLKNIRWNFRTYSDQSIRSVDVRKALTAAHGKVRIIKMNSIQPIEDVSSKFE